jgi:hypothetical protein
LSKSEKFAKKPKTSKKRGKTLAKKTGKGYYIAIKMTRGYFARG